MSSSNDSDGQSPEKDADQTVARAVNVAIADGTSAGDEGAAANEAIDDGTAAGDEGAAVNEANASPSERRSKSGKRRSQRDDQKRSSKKADVDGASAEGEKSPKRSSGGRSAKKASDVVPVDVVVLYVREANRFLRKFINIFLPLVPFSVN